MKHTVLNFILFTALLATGCKPNTSADSATDDTAAGSAKGITYQIDAPRSEIKWEGSKPLGTHHGIMPITGGNITIDNGMVTAGEIVISVKDLEVQDMEVEYKEKLEGHLKGTTPGKEDDFFNVGKYPTATFTVQNSSRLENDPTGTHMINGQLTMKGITKPVSFKATLDLSNSNAIKATSETFTIDRTEWDIKFQSKKIFTDLKDDFINDEVKLQITVGALRVES